MILDEQSCSFRSLKRRSVSWGNSLQAGQFIVF